MISNEEYMTARIAELEAQLSHKDEIIREHEAAAIRMVGLIEQAEARTESLEEDVRITHAVSMELQRDANARAESAIASANAWTEAALNHWPLHKAFDPTNPAGMIANIVQASEARAEEAERQAGAIEAAFTAGKLQYESDDLSGQKTECPHPQDSIERHWWTRGYAYTARVIRYLMEMTARSECEALYKNAESEASRLRAALEAVEKWMSGKGDGYALFDLWGAGDIGCFEDIEWDWETTIESVRDLSIALSKLSGEDLPDWRIEPVVLYRQILAALSPDCQRQAALSKTSAGHWAASRAQFEYITATWRFGLVLEEPPSWFVATIDGFSDSGALDKAFVFALRQAALGGEERPDDYSEYWGMSESKARAIMEEVASRASNLKRGGKDKQMKCIPTWGTRYCVNCLRFIKRRDQKCAARSRAALAKRDGEGEA